MNVMGSLMSDGFPISTQCIRVSSKSNTSVFLCFGWDGSLTLIGSIQWSSGLRTLLRKLKMFSELSRCYFIVKEVCLMQYFEGRSGVASYSGWILEVDVRGVGFHFVTYEFRPFEGDWTMVLCLILECEGCFSIEFLSTGSEARFLWLVFTLLFLLYFDFVLDFFILWVCSSVELIFDFRLLIWFSMVRSLVCNSAKLSFFLLRILGFSIIGSLPIFLRRLWLYEGFNVLIAGGFNYTQLAQCLGDPFGLIGFADGSLLRLFFVMILPQFALRNRFFSLLSLGEWEGLLGDREAPRDSMVLDFDDLIQTVLEIINSHGVFQIIISFQMSQGAFEDRAYEDILRAPGISLASYRTDPPTANLFPDASNYPQFFNENLVNDNRVIKQFLNDPHSNIRIFYFQLLRLGFEINTENNAGREFATTFRRLVFYPEFEILFTHDSENMREVYNDFQFKKLFAEFFHLLEVSPNVNIQRMVNSYPIIDQIMIHILRSILLNQGINEEFTAIIPTQMVFGELSSIIGLHVTSYGNCWKFEDSDMFCYEQDQMSIYLAYVLEENPAVHTSAVSEMVAINYYENLGGQTITASITEETKIESDSRRQTYITTTTSTYESAFPSIQPITTGSAFVEPKTYITEPTSYSISSPIAPITSPSYLGLDYTKTYETNNFASDSYITSHNYGLDAGSAPSAIPTSYTPSAEINNYSGTNYATSAYTTTSPTYLTTNYASPSYTATAPTSYAATNYTLTSDNPLRIMEDRRSVTLIEEAPLSYGVGSGASQKVSSSNPAKESMISEYFQFQAFTGETTIQKTKVPRSEAERDKGIAGGNAVVHFNKDDGLNSMKFGDLGGFMKKPQEQVEKTVPAPSSTANYSSTNYEYKGYQTTVPPSTTAGVSTNKTSIDQFLEEIRRYTSQPIRSQMDYSSIDTYGAAGTYGATNLPSYEIGAANKGATDNYTGSYTSSKDPYSAYTSYTSPYSSFTTPQDYNFYSSNPYVSGGTTTQQQYSSTATQQLYQPYTPSSPSASNSPYKKDQASTDYLTRYGVSSPAQSAETYATKAPMTFEPSYTAIQTKQQTKSTLERISGSEYKPTYNYQTATYQQPKPLTSYDKYNYQSPSSGLASGTTSYSNYNVDYKKDFSGLGSYDTVNRARPEIKPRTAGMPVQVQVHHQPIQPPMKPIPTTLSRETNVKSGPVISGRYVPNPVYSHSNYRK